LYPYRVFFSPELLSLEKRCSICNLIISPRKPCGHRVGEIYNGELTVREVTKAKVLGIAIVEKPVQKYSVLFLVDPETGKSQDHYDYSLIRYLARGLLAPFDGWDYTETKKRHPHSIFTSVKNKDSCPCESGKIYEECCLSTEGVLRPHHEFSFEKPPQPELMKIEYSGY
jgi:hypothetical protein